MKTKLLLPLLLLISGSSSYAASVTGATKATATLASSCKLSVSDVSLGAYLASGVSTANTNGSTIQNKTPSDFTVTCSKGLAFSVSSKALVGGQYYAMSSSTTSDILKYHIWSTSDYYTGWAGNGPLFNSTGTGSAQTFTMYVGIPQGQYVAPGNYSDTNVMTVNF